MKHLISFTLSLLFAFAVHAHETKKPSTGFLESAEPIRNSFATLAQDEGAAGFFLAPLLERNRVAPGLVIIGPSEQQEIETAHKLAELFHKRLGYTIVLFTGNNGNSVPAFDGLILDENNEAVANLTLKSSVNPIPDTITSTSRNAISKVQKYSDVETWLQHLKFNTEWRSNALMPDTEKFEFSDDKHYSHFTHTRDSFQFMLAVLAVSSNRPTWLVLDIMNTSQISEDVITDLQKYLTKRVSQALVFVPEGYYELTESTSAFNQLECARFLKP